MLPQQVRVFYENVVLADQWHKSVASDAARTVNNAPKAFL
jgi:hypothetical protein